FCAQKNIHILCIAMCHPWSISPRLKGAAIGFCTPYPGARHYTIILLITRCFMATPFKPRTTAIVLCMAVLFCAGIYEAQSQPYFVYQRTFYEGVGTYQDGCEIVQTSDGGYAIGGFHGGPPMGIGTFYLIKAD